MSTVVEFGNPAPADAKAAEQKGVVVTRVVAPDDKSIGEVFADITAADGIWNNHAEKNTKPVWVESSSDGLAMLLAEHYRCPVGRKAAAKGRK